MQKTSSANTLIIESASDDDDADILTAYGGAGIGCGACCAGCGGSVTTEDGTEVSGTWAWEDGAETMSKTGTYERTAVFTADDDTYGTIEATVSVKVYTSSSGGSSSSSSSGSSSGAASTTSYAVTAMRWAAGTGLVSGRDDGTFDPQSGETRAETAAMLMRFIEAE